MATTTIEPRTGTYRGSWVIEWLTTVDHKKIGILYIANSFLFFFAAGILALVIRSELAVPTVTTHAIGTHPVRGR